MYERVIRSAQGGHTETAAMAQWMTGETYVHQQDFDSAKKAFDRVIALYDFAEWRAASLLQIGTCHLQLGDPRQAARALSRLVDEYPQSPYLDEAKRRLHDLQESAAVARNTKDIRP
jgi:TolA-binding protein